MTHPLSIFAEFDTETQRAAFFSTHVRLNLLPLGGPIFSYSMSDESDHSQLNKGRSLHDWALKFL